jgi:hypothetical protein
MKVTYARRIGWHEMGNGELIQKGEESGYQVLLRNIGLNFGWIDP